MQNLEILKIITGIKATYRKHILKFKRPSGTSRGILNEKTTYFLILNKNNATGVGECGLLKGLSVDDVPDYEAKLEWVCNNIDLGFDALYKALSEFPSIQFGLEIAFKSLFATNKFELFPSNFTAGKDAIPINGLVWMGEKAFMKSQIIEKINAGFNCIKLKIGAIDFNTELELLSFIRSEFAEADIEIRVDANGAFTIDEALDKLKKLSELNLHSIEQPIKPNQHEAMASLCEQSPLPIALDEELIGVFNVTNQHKLLQIINPQFIILKPSLIGGFKASDIWIEMAEKMKIGWWITSALESNVGLNAIAQFTYIKNTKMHQGLGTGELYTNNIHSPLHISNGALNYNPSLNWDF